MSASAASQSRYIYLTPTFLGLRWRPRIARIPGITSFFPGLAIFLFLFILISHVDDIVEALVHFPEDSTVALSNGGAGRRAGRFAEHDHPGDLRVGLGADGQKLLA